MFKSAILLACALVFLGYLFYHLRKDRKRKDLEDLDDTDLF
ncbi:MAG: CcoQ/FixQ family Cbb3-type cytochrome c oxidase assembly chaperone [Clostridia bacterium]|nr:CcoQ/FixQ family Cbb3-type cytochrome c oxidase assembly chaperone [Clostridia bacterium]